MGWEYKSFVPITGENPGAFFPNGSVSMPHVTAFARPRPEAVAGVALSWAFDASAASFNFSFSQAALNETAAASSTLVFLPGLVWPSGANFTVCSQPAGATTAVVWNPPPYTPVDPSAPPPFPWVFLALSATAGAPQGAAVSVVVSEAALPDPPLPGCIGGFAQMSQL